MKKFEIAIPVIVFGTIIIVAVIGLFLDTPHPKPEARYIRDVRQILVQVDKANEAQLITLAQDVTTPPHQITAALSPLLTAHSKLRGLAPPDSLLSLHTEILDLSTLCNNRLKTNFAGAEILRPINPESIALCFMAFEQIDKLTRRPIQ